MSDYTFENFDEHVGCATSLEALETLRVAYFGKQGLLTKEMKTLKDLDPEERKEKGAHLNTMRLKMTQTFDARKVTLEDAALTRKLESERIDMTAPAFVAPKGTRHVITHTMESIASYFQALGFAPQDGPDIDDEEHNFNALNIPEHHPARQNHDTFYLKGAHHTTPLLLRTHTSTVQIRTMKKNAPPLRILSYGRVYRSDYDATHLPMFHQMEGLVIEKDIHVGHLKKCLNDFVRSFFNDAHLETRFRPSFFPFTSPSFEMDIKFHNTWLEVLGCGMVHPFVLRHVNIDPTQHQGFAFGLGIDRFAMLKHNVEDIRHFISGDVRWSAHMNAS